ncbi:MAG: hypothetical protein LRY50_08110 [Geovibrio sp.]|nr:hypothetical protein [Geovibrio sp.]
MLINGYTRRLIQLALDEDIGTGDLTAGAFESFKSQATFNFIAKDNCIICGTKVAQEVYFMLDHEVKVEFSVKDGDRITERRIIGQVTGPASSILTGERTSLNFLQRLSGVATNTAKYVEALGDSNIKNTRHSQNNPRLAQDREIRSKDRRRLEPQDRPL